MEYADKSLGPASKNTPKPYFPKLGIFFRVEDTGDRRKVFGRWFKCRRYILLWAYPRRSRYVERYCLEFLATFKGHAKRRNLVVFDWVPMHLPNVALYRLQSQEKFYPIEGEWIEDYPDNG